MFNKNQKFRFNLGLRSLSVVLFCWLLAVGGIFTSMIHAQESSSLAKVAAIKNIVEAKPNEQANWKNAARDQPLGAGDRVRTGAESRAALLYSDNTLHRLDEKSEVEILPPQDNKSGLLKVLSGKHYFSSRKPKNFGRVETSTVTAAIKGTEFTVEIDASGTTTITMLEGVVEASNDYGSIEVTAGEQAITEPGKAPVRSVVVRPRDAVMWTLYYPPVVSARDRARLETIGKDGTHLERAVSLLSSGQATEAQALVQDVLSRQPNDPVALSLASVLALARDDKSEAEALAEKAMRADPQSSAAVLAASYVAQAKFDIERAASLAERAARLDTEDPTVLSRAAEMRLAQGDTRAAEDALQRALNRDGENPHARTVLGFVHLTQLETKQAVEQFEQALNLDSNLANAHLGLGIANIRLRNLEAGRERIQTAALLDTGSSLMRAYLGKAYYEEKRAYEALKEFELAKELDEADPTPYLYSALVLQNENRPVEALDDLYASIERNDNRAVYRSKMLLDEDRSVRSADLARVFNDLGFEEAGLVTARKSADANHANHSSHYFLAGIYRNQPRYASALFSELLQARIYQPVGSNAARPDAVNATASLNEYTALFNRPRTRAFVVTEYGDTDTDLSAFDSGASCGGVPCYTLSEIDSSNRNRAEITLTTGGDRYAAAISYSSFSDDGFRLNSDEDTQVFRGFAQFALSSRDSLQVSAIQGSRESGDLPFRQLLPTITPERFETDETNIGLGYHRQVAPGSDLAISATWNQTEQSAGFIGSPPLGMATIEGPQLEVQWVEQQNRASWTFGAGVFDGDVEIDNFSSSVIQAEDSFTNGYAYYKFPTKKLEWTLGAAIEEAEVPVGLLPPRDSNIGSAQISISETELSPKVGVTFNVGSGTTFRVGAYHRLAPFLGRLQTLEPTQVSGFNQFFEDPGGTRSWNYGVGFDQRVGTRTFFGLSHLERDLEVPEAYCDRATEWNPFSGCAFVTPSVVETREDDESISQAYVSFAPVKWMAASIDAEYEDRDLETTFVTPTGLFQDAISTLRLRPEMRFFSAKGWFVRVGGTLYDQSVDQFGDLSSTTRTEVTSDFWIFDSSVGYRFPGRWGSIVLDARNVTNRKFVFYERTIQERVIPARTILARIEITY